MYVYRALCLHVCVRLPVCVRMCVCMYVCTVADPEGGGVGGLNPHLQTFFFFRLSVYENSHGPGP